MNRQIAKLCRKLATQDGVFDKGIYKKLKKNAVGMNHARFIFETYLQTRNKNTTNKEETK